MTRYLSGTAHVTIDTKKLNLYPGTYNIIVKYGGNKSDGLKPCEASAVLHVT